MNRIAAAFGIAGLAFAAGLAGSLVGQRLAPATPADNGAALHRVLHRELALDARQNAGLEALEQRYAARRRTLQLEMRAANARLADAIAAEHAAGPQVNAAIEASHAAMGDLQKATVAHVFAMRRLLRPDQVARFDQAIGRALIADDR